MNEGISLFVPFISAQSLMNIEKNFSSFSLKMRVNMR